MESLEQVDQAELQPELQAPIPLEEKNNWGRVALDIVETLLLAAILFLGINAISARVRVDGFSMVPTLEDGEFVLVSKLDYRFGEVERGDIVVFHYPVDPTQELIKRVIGLSGDTVKVQDGVVSVNGQILNEPYIADTPDYAGEWIVPEGHVFVLGDNRNDSHDSHQWGYLPFEKIVGKAIVIYWPPSLWKVIQHTTIPANQ